MKAKYKKNGRLNFRTLRRYFIDEYAIRYIMIAKTLFTLNARLSELRQYADPAIVQQVDDFRKLWFLERGLLVGGTR